MIQTVISALNEGFVQTLKLFVVTLVGSIPLGLVICFGSMSRWAPLSMDFSGEYTRINMGQLCPLLRFAFFSGGDKSEEEVRTLAKAAVDNGAKTAVVTMGMRGSYLLEKGREHRQEAHAAQVVDALGAGDSFIAAFLARYHANGGDLADAANEGSAYAARCCGYYGAFGHAIAEE